jgi:hypothetical protein
VVAEEVVVQPQLLEPQSEQQRLAHSQSQKLHSTAQQKHRRPERL